MPIFSVIEANLEIQELKSQPSELLSPEPLKSQDDKLSSGMIPDLLEETKESQIGASEKVSEAIEQLICRETKVESPDFHPSP